MYEVLQDRKNTVGDRHYRVLRIVFAGGQSIPQTMNEIMDLAVQTMNEDDDTEAVLIFGFSSRARETHSSFDRGRVMFTRDGKGWLGDGMHVDRKTKDKFGCVFYELNINSSMSFYVTAQVDYDPPKLISLVDRIKRRRSQ